MSIHWRKVAENDFTTGWEQSTIGGIMTLDTNDLHLSLTHLSDHVSMLEEEANSTTRDAELPAYQSFCQDVRDQYSVVRGMIGLSDGATREAFVALSTRLRELMQRWL